MNLVYKFGENKMPELINAQVLFKKNSGGPDLDFLAIHLYHPKAPESQNNQVVTPVRLYINDISTFNGCFNLAPPLNEPPQNTPRWRRIFAWMHVSLQNDV